MAIQQISPAIIQQLKTASRQTVRKPTATLGVVWADVSAENTIVSTGTPTNRASITEQVNHGLGYQKYWAYCETDDPSVRCARLDSCYAMPDVIPNVPYTGTWLVGWWGDGTSISDADGYFNSPPTLIIKLYPVPFSSYEIKGFMGEEYPVDWDLLLTHNGQVFTECP